MSQRRRVLIISHVFPPLVAGGAPRMGQFARLLPDLGWDVTVLTASHKTSGIDNAALERLRGRATIVEAWSPASAAIKRGTPAPKKGLKGIVRKVVRTAALSVVFPDREIFWVPSAIRTGQKALREIKHDVVFASHGPQSNLIVGRALAKQFDLPLVVEFRDLWATLPIDSFFVTPLHKRLALQLERAHVRAAARVIGVAPAMAAQLATSHGVSLDRAVSITNGFDPDDVARVHDDRKGDRPFRLVYTGSLNLYHDISGFWRAVRALADRRAITPETFRIEFVGNLSMDDVEKFGVESFVESSGFVPHDKVFDAFARADALLMMETPGYYAKFSYAAKLFDYLITGKPVVALVEAGGNSWSLLDAAGVGLFAGPNDQASIERVLEQAIAAKGAAPKRVDPDAPPYRDFNRRHLVAKLASVFDDVAREH